MDELKILQEFIFQESQIVVNQKMVKLAVGDVANITTKKGQEIKKAKVVAIKNAEVHYKSKGKTKTVPIPHIKSLSITEKVNGGR